MLSIFLASAAFTRIISFRSPLAQCAPRFAMHSGRPRRTRQALACEASFAAPRPDADVSLPVRPEPAAGELPPKPNGIVVAYKPQNWTSFDVVAKARGCMEGDLRKAGHVFKRRSRLKVGHGGTLDPMAEGLLVLGVGMGCKGLDGYLKGGKAYRATAKLGEETDTQDIMGEVIRRAATTHVSLADLREAAAGLTGTILQRPPIYSALRRDGKRLHELARAGKVSEEDVEPREVTIHHLEVTHLDEATGTFGLNVRCGGGTYVRTLIVDLARAVGSAAHMTALVRTQVGPFACEDTGAPGVAVVQPVRESDFADAGSYYASMASSAKVLAALGQTSASSSIESLGSAMSHCK
mmetsp:Transcript_30463/g.93094  ORF Transcript_30463/g.93094 Transcript_30463/m.93094 type:complete len:352 (-) Transcript_30463:84-1139(-)